MSVKNDRSNCNSFNWHSSISISSNRLYSSNNAIVKVKIEELEKHVNKHNQVIERTYTLERDLATYWSKYDELKERIIKLEKKV